MDLPQEVQAYQQAHLQELASRPNTTVLTVQHDSIADPWTETRLTTVLNSLQERILAADDEVDDFVLRKRCLEDPETLAFQRQHPKFYWMLTDRKLMREDKFRGAVLSMIQLRGSVERGEVAAGQEADAMATKKVMEALSGTE
jgi:hypothetical protein